MSSRPARPDPAAKASPDAAAPRKRFRIEKLEERIAPTKGGKGTHNCGGTSSITVSSGGSYY
ncbi:MAG TPA: hypothetical protein VFG37_04705 [Planctomycetota bacterium]|jgi:hypothetical protein|nr:hypothetical protein [Planctomycetota bacterium]